MKKSKYIMLAAVMAVLLAFDGWTAYRFGLRSANRARPAASSVVSAGESDPIARFRTEREQLRARQTAQLNDIIYSDRSGAETIEAAQRQLLDMLKASGREQTLEGILQARGFEDALVTASGDSVNVLLRQEHVTQQESAVILELVLRETGVTGGNVKIIPVN